MDRGACRATIHRVAWSQTWLKRISTHAHTLYKDFVPRWQEPGRVQERVWGDRAPGGELGKSTPLPGPGRWWAAGQNETRQSVSRCLVPSPSTLPGGGAAALEQAESCGKQPGDAEAHGCVSGCSREGTAGIRAAGLPASASAQHSR